MATIRPHGKRWQVQIRRKGHPITTKSFLLRRDADTWARQTEAALERGELPVPSTRPSERATLGALVIRYRDTVSTRKKGHEVERIVLNAFLRDPICSKWVDQLTPSDFASYRDRRLLKVTNNTLRREFSTIHHLLETALTEWGLPMAANPVHRLRIGKPMPHRERRLRDGEEDALIRSANRCRNPLMRTIISFALETAMRRGEILGLTWNDIDLPHRSLVIPDSKNGSSRHVPLTRAALELLVSIPGTGDRPFPMNANAFRLTWERVRTRAQLEDFHFHDLRHEAISRLFERGLTVPEVASVSGHKDARMLFRYAHPMRERVLQVLDRAHSSETSNEDSVLT